MYPAIVHVGWKILGLIVDSAFRSLLLACVVAVVLAAFRMRAVHARLVAWRGVLLVATAMPLLLWLAPALPLPVPVPSFSRVNLAAVPQSFQAAPAFAPVQLRPMQSQSTGHSLGQARREAAAPLALKDVPPAPLPQFSSRSPGWTISWPFAALCLYLAVAWIFAARVLIGTYFGRRLRQSSRIVGDAHALDSLCAASRACGLRQAPLLAESDLLVVPVTLGILRPAVLLPSVWRNWDGDELAAVLAHEVSHVARRDALVQLLALIHRAIFWFSPLSWWVEQHLADLAEHASDEAALAGGAERTRYAQVLIGFLAQLESSPARASWRSLAMAKAGQGEKRIDRILAWRSSMNTRVSRPLIVAMVTICALVVALSATAHPIAYSAQNTTVPTAPAPPLPPSALVPPQPAPAPPPGPVAVPAEPTDTIPQPPQVAQPADPPTPPQAAVADPEPPQPPQASQPSAAPPAPPAPPPPVAVEPPDVHLDLHLGPMGGTYWPWGSNFVIVTHGSDHLILSGSEDDAEHARALRSKIPGDFIWFKRDGKSYVIRDQATVDRAKQIWAQRADAAQQRQQLEAKERELSRRMRQQVQQRMQEIRVKIPDMSAELQKLQDEIKELSAKGATMQDLGDLQRQLGEMQQSLGQARWNSNMEEINRRAGELGRQMGELGRQIGELARQGVAQWRQSSDQMGQLLDDSIARGIAKPE